LNDADCGSRRGFVLRLFGRRQSLAARSFLSDAECSRLMTQGVSGSTLRSGASANWNYGPPLEV
jgi:hypothetical protein